MRISVNEAKIQCKRLANRISEHLAEMERSNKYNTQKFQELAFILSLLQEIVGDDYDFND